MSTSVHEELVSAVIDRLKTITTGNGYRTDIGNSVDDWRADSDEIDAAMLPRLVVKDTEQETREAYLSSGEEHDLTVQIVGLTNEGAQSLGKTRALNADIKTAIYTDQTFGNRAIQTRITGFRQARHLERTDFGIVEVTAVIRYWTRDFDPYKGVTT